MVFLPSRLWSLLTYTCTARHSNAGATSSPAPAAVSALCAINRLQVKSWPAPVPCQRPTSNTLMPGEYVSSTIRTFSSGV